MKVILLKDIKKVGKKDEVIEVSDGYARNYLIKRNLAIAYTKGSQKVLNEQLAQKAEEEKQLKAEAEVLKAKLEKMRLEFTLSTGKEGQVFGSISTKQIHQALLNQGMEVDKRKIHLDAPVSSLGMTNVEVDLYKGQVIGTIHVHVSEKR
ncbi:50S ribosomal protein L9 [Faecalicoccus acidiformans]|uniref:Large ribosomal subunit protein bL9 n=1 Tax=Faecalicoccus acidiformans TaxID=915173 RepID=A0ABS2FKT6_9FIRM|nr:50S ribosomal protein L9 [Faecalicoccus acidiformans]MBM6830576.1 50S ribosomal protein L9 [Faecalicoccus acidiformans]